VRGSDHRPNESLHRHLTRKLGATPPEYVHHGLVLGPDGSKLSKRDAMSSVADLRDAGIPAEAVRAYLDELGLPRHDVQLDLTRIRRLAVEAIGAMSDDDLAARVGVPTELVPALRGARDLQEAREYARQIVEPEPVQLPADARPTLERFKELLDGDARETVRELKAAGGDLRALRLALTGRDRGPELWTVIHALPREEALRRVDAAL
jgi:glutamyl/glutaminyl-tRNA synthetase